MSRKQKILQNMKKTVGKIIVRKQRIFKNWKLFLINKKKIQKNLILPIVSEATFINAKKIYN